MGLVIREASIHDSERIANLSGQLGYATNAERTAWRLSQLLNNTDHCVYVVMSEEEVAGWIHAFYSLTVEYDPCIEIGGFVIDADHRRMGIGKMLVDKVTVWAISKGMNRIRVRSNSIRKESHAFYLKHGFVPVKEQKVYDLHLA